MSGWYCTRILVTSFCALALMGVPPRAVLHHTCSSTSYTPTASHPHGHCPPARAAAVPLPTAHRLVAGQWYWPIPFLQTHLATRKSGVSAAFPLHPSY